VAERWGSICCFQQSLRHQCCSIEARVIVATLLSGGFLYTLLLPPGSVLLPVDAALQIAIFLLVGIGFALVSEGLRTAWERAAAAEQSKDLLLQELGHRTKNNLALVTSVLSLQARLKTDAESRQALEKAIARIQAIAQAHEYFRPVHHEGGVEMRSYLENLCNHLAEALRDIRPIAVKVNAEPGELKTEQAVAVGLIVNELVTNALKHAFPGDRSGTVCVTLRRTPWLSVVVQDDGVGCPVNRDERLGSRLTRLLAKQLGAEITWEALERGCRVRVEIHPGAAN
jgi:two-component sensor histidine kinase